MPNDDCCPTCGTRNLRASTVPILHTPRIEQLISINEPPLEFEEAPPRDIVSQGPQILSDLDAKIADVKDILQQLLRERSQVTDNLAIAKNILHPIRRLPTDMEGHRYKYPKALVFHQLTFPNRRKPYLGIYVDIGKLTFRITLRWPSFFLPAIDGKTGSFKNLRYLHAGLNDRDGYTLSIDPLLDAFEYSPNLTHIAFSNVGDPLQVCSLPWSQITVYDGADGPDDENITETPHLHVLTKMPLLESARLYCDKHSTIPVSGRVHLPRLQNLTLEEGYTAVAGSLSQCFSALSLPSLTELRLGYTTYRNPVQLPSIVYPTGIVAPRITSLQLTFCFELSPTANGNILIFLADLPTVIHLMVQAEAITDGLIEGLIRRHGILPSLRYLDFRGSALDLDEPGLFITMLESRLSPSASDVVTDSMASSTVESLHELRLDEGFTIDAADRQRWDDLSERGLIVRYGAEGLGDRFDHIASHGRDDLLFRGMPWIP
ncbi:hypothetical protein ARMSODRAFT_1089873 [Armillaria solidipes]|uniref:F-box domain-containing protein n=1 Tax=Armillaria solidipes TaxID=1076256 RepID=A0A2H3B9A3_9AGAR|nr:hypothetical protein ARMSODRAFT_1089873 [Armillaria solidipes]